MEFGVDSLINDNHFTKKKDNHTKSVLANKKLRAGMRYWMSSMKGSTPCEDKRSNNEVPKPSTSTSTLLMVGGSWRWSPTKVATPSFLIFIKGTNTASSVVCPASSMRTHPKSLPCKTGWSAPAQVLQTTSASSKIARWCARWPLSSLWSAALASCKFCCRSHAPMKTKLNILQERICTESFMHSFNLFFFQKWRNPSLTISSKLYFSRSKHVASGRPMRTTFNPAFTQPAVRLSTSNKKIQKISEFLGEFLRALRKLRDFLDQVERLQCWSRRSKARGHAGRPSSHEPTARPWWFSPHRVAPESRTNASTEKECVLENWSFWRSKKER